MYVVGELFVLGVAYFFRNWHVMNWAMAGYSILTVFVIWLLIPESPRYYVSVGKNEKALKLLNKIGKFNGKDTSEVLKDSLALDNLVNEDKEQTSEVTDKISSEEKKQKLSILWKPRQNLIKTGLFLYIWFALSLVYYGVSLGKTYSQYKILTHI